MIEKISLNSLKFFYFVAQYGSVTLAAKKLFITQSAVSKQIHKLEDTLNITLFNRHNKTLLLTEKGKVLRQCCEHIFGQLDMCLNELTQDNIEKKPLVLSCEPTLSMKWLIPRLNQFNALNHHFDVVLLTAGGSVDFENQPIDIAIRRNDFDWGEHIFAEKIADEYITIVQSSHMPSDQKLLIPTSRPHFRQHIHKNRQFKKSIRELPIMELEHFYLCLEACLSGLGAAVMSLYMIEKELQWQVLQMTSPVVADNSSYYLLSHSAFEKDARKVIFLDWLKHEMQNSQIALQNWIQPI